MNTRLKIKLIIPEGYDFGTSKSSLLHGVISQLIPGEYVSEMHTAGDHPYSQYSVSENGSWYWVVNTLDERAAENIIRPLSELGRQYKAEIKALAEGILNKYGFDVTAVAMIKKPRKK